MQPTCIRMGLMALGCCLATGCATSDDPREGGLFGYWATGEKGYEERLEKKRGNLDIMRDKVSQTEAENEALRMTRDAKARQLAEQSEALEALDREIAEIRSTTAELELDTDQRVAERKQLQTEMADIQMKLDELRAQPLPDDVQSAVSERQRAVRDLQRELRLLRERASLLTTL